MTRNNNININFNIKATVLIAAFAVSASLASDNNNKTVTLSFVDSAMVNDTIIRLGDIAKIDCGDAALASAFRAFSVGEAAPAGYSRFVNSEDLVSFNIRRSFKGVNVVAANQKRVKVASDYRTVTIGEFEEAIRKYAAERLEWGTGEWSLTVVNPESSYKIGRGGDIGVEVSGIDNPRAKGGVRLTLTLRCGSRVSRIPVACKIFVKTAVLVSARPIQRGEELTEENTMVQLTDITSFAYTPLTKLPKAGTATTLRFVPMGGILHDKALRAIPLVARGDQVRIHYIGERVRISVLGTARDNGGNGERVWVENLQTGKLIRATVSGKGSVVVHQEGEKS
ncbi:MAG: flagellar basal body P-ring formation chaperone FlgA [Chitinispirillales bacterium]|jgi:flagella basal body P-ring formation protein FlgA|nr:flagellar basal body P-ring formation chaperone FlgA [Chitinispirillales bacterium]